MLNTKRSIFVLLVLSLVFIFTLSTFAQSKTEVEMWHYCDPEMDSPEGRFMSKALEQFNDTHQDIEIELVTYDGEKIERNFTLASESGDAPDVMIIRRHYLAQQVARDNVAPLNDYYENWDNRPNFYDSYVQNATFDGKLMGIPFYTDGVIFYYRKDLYEKYNLEVPKTWSQMIENAKVLTREIDGKKMWGMGTIAAKTLVTPERWFYYLLQAGGDPLTEDDGKATYDSPAGVRALDLYRKLVDEYEVMPKDTNVTMDDLVTGFASGVYGQAAMGTWQVRVLQEDPEFWEEKVGIARLPIPEDGEERILSGGWAYVMSPQSEVKEEAWEVVKFFTDVKRQLLWTKILGTIPVSSEVADDPDLPEWIGFASKYIKESATMFPQHSHYSELLDGLGDVVQKTIAGRLSSPEEIEEALQRAADRFNSNYVE